MTRIKNPAFLFRKRREAVRLTIGSSIASLHIRNPQNFVGGPHKAA